MPDSIYDPLSGAIVPFSQFADGWAEDNDISGVPSYTWATLPLASAYTGLAVISDVGVAPSLWRSNGTAWAPVNGRVLLARAMAPQTAITGTTNETNAAAAIVIPAGLMGANGGLQISTRWAVTNSANDKTLKAKLGATAFETILVTSVASLLLETTIDNVNDAAVQIGGNGAAPQVGTATAFAAGTINTAVAQNLTFTGQLESSGESIQLLSYEVWLRR